MDDQRGIALSLHALGEVALAQGDHEQAGVRFAESLARSRELGDKLSVAPVLNNLGLVAWHRSDYTGARRYFEESLALRQELGDQRGIAVCLAGLAGVAGVYAQPERAARLLGVAAALLETIGGRLDAIERALYEHNVAAAQSALGADQFMKAWAAGRAMPLEQAIADALSEGGEATELPQQRQATHRT